MADAYLFVVSTWTKPTGTDSKNGPTSRVRDAVAGRERVQEAMRTEFCSELASFRRSAGSSHCRRDGDKESGRCGSCAHVANSPDAVVVHNSATERRAQADAEIAD